MRQPFAYQKRTYDTFGTGLPDKIRTELHSDNSSTRRSAIRKLIKKWTDERIVKLRLSKEEEALLRKQLAEMRKKGENLLKKWQSDESDFQQFYKDWEECALCSGASQ